MQATDGVYRISDGIEWMTLVTIQENMVVDCDGPWHRELIGLTLGDIEEMARLRNLQVKRVE